MSRLGSFVAPFAVLLSGGLVLDVADAHNWSDKLTIGALITVLAANLAYWLAPGRAAQRATEIARPRWTQRQAEAAAEAGRREPVLTSRPGNL
jgi:hypothetical protein